MDESRPTHVWVMSHIWMSHITRRGIAVGSSLNLYEGSSYLLRRYHGYVFSYFIIHQLWWVVCTSYIHVFMDIYIYIYVIYVCTFMFLYMYVYTYMYIRYHGYVFSYFIIHQLWWVVCTSYIYVFMDIYIHIYVIYVCTFIFIYMYVYTYMYINMYVYICSYIYMYIHISIHTHI